MRLENKVAVVTASTRGIGLACVEAMVNEGAIVYMAARNIAKAEGIRDELLSKKPQAKIGIVYNDATKFETYESMLEEVYEKEGRLDILVNNFGTSNPQKDLDILNTDFNDFKETMEINMASVFLSTQKAAKIMEKTGGSIINISSVSGTKPDLSQIAYGSVKASINHFTKICATQLAKYQIRCNAVLPGMTGTDAVNDKLNDQFKEIFLANTPLGRMAKPSEIAAAVVYFASDDSAFVTGQILEVAGGFGMPTPIYSDLVKNSTNR